MWAGGGLPRASAAPYRKGFRPWKKDKERENIKYCSDHLYVVFLYEYVYDKKKAFPTKTVKLVSNQFGR